MRLGELFKAVEDQPEVLEEIRGILRTAHEMRNLLRYHYGYDLDGIPRGKIAPCESPGQYQEDCGKCLRCKSVYGSGPHAL